jgi:hypothetical protein
MKVFASLRPARITKGRLFLKKRTKNFYPPHCTSPAIRASPAGAASAFAIRARPPQTSIASA